MLLANGASYPYQRRCHFSVFWMARLESLQHPLCQSRDRRVRLMDDSGVA